MPSPPNTTPLGLFYGDQGGPSATSPTPNKGKNCPYLDPEENAFCTLDGAMCPFVGFEYSRCKKYTNNVAKGLMRQNVTSFSPPGKPPRLEALTEGSKKKDDNPELASFGGKAHNIPDDADDILAQFGVNDIEAPDSVPNPPRKATAPQGQATARPKAKAKVKVVNPKGKPRKKADKTNRAVATDPMELAKKLAAEKAAAQGLKPPKEDTSAAGDIKPSDIRDLPVRNLKPKNKTQERALELAKSLEIDVKGGGKKVPTDDEMHTLWTVLLTDTTEFSDEKKLRDKRINDAEFLTAILKRVANVDGYHAKQKAISAAMIINTRRGDNPVDNPDERQKAQAAAAKANDSAAARYAIDKKAGKKETVGAVPHKEVTPSHYSDVFPKARLPVVVGPPEGKTGKPNFWSSYSGEKAKDPETSPTKAKPTGSKARTAWIHPFFGSLPKVAPVAQDDDDEEEYEYYDDEDEILGADKEYAKESSQYTNYDQFRAFMTVVKQLPLADQKVIFAGYTHEGKNPKQARKELKRVARKLAKRKNYRELARLKTVFSDRVKDVNKIKHKQTMFRQEWDSNLATLRKLPVGDREALKMHDRLLRDDKAKTAVAGQLNRMMDKLYTLQTQTVKIGDQEVKSLVREITLPTFSKTDYETMKMSEQMGLAALHKTHQYGRHYGKWNSWFLFAKSVVMPLLLAFTPHAKLIKPLMTMWPHHWFDQFYGAYLAKPLPKLQAGEKRTTLLPSRNDKFLASQKMMTDPTAQKRIMRGWDKDAMLPPDKAIAHTRWYPTTKVPWTRVRHQKLIAQYRKTKANLLPRITKRSFLRR